MFYRYLLLPLFILGTIPSLISQTFKPGKITKEQLEELAKGEENFPDAEAIILLDEGSSHHTISSSAGVKVTYKRHCYIKILKEEGLEFANQSLKFTRYENASQVKGYTYNFTAGGMVQTKLEKAQIFTEEIRDNVYERTFTLPKVKVGSIIEFYYSITNSDIGYIRTWEFQSEIPALKSKFYVSVPTYFELNHPRFIGYVPVTKSDYKEKGGGGHTNQTYDTEVVNVPAFEEPPHLSSPDNFISSVYFEISAVNFPNSPRRSFAMTWEDIDRTYRESDRFTKAITRGVKWLHNQSFRTQIKDKATSKEDLLREALAFTQKNISWNSRKRTMLSETTIKKAYTDGKGSSADINLFLVSLVKSLGFSCDPVLMSTRKNGWLRQDQPGLSQLNYVIACAEIDGKRYFMDATSEGTDLNVLPFRCQNGNGRLMRFNGEWVDLSKVTSGTTSVSANLKIDTEGIITGKFNMSHKGYDNFAKRLEVSDDEKEKEYIKELESDISGEISNWTFTKPEKASKSLKLTGEVELETSASVAEGQIRFNPIVFFNYDKNPFQLEERLYPVEFGHAQKYVVMYNYQVPEGYQIKYLPESKKFTLGDGLTYTYILKSRGSMIQIQQVFDRKQTMFVQNDYADLRQFYSQFIKQINEQIILEKQ